MQLRYNFVIAGQRGTRGKEATMFDIRTAWRRLTAKISGSTDQEIIDTTEAEDSSGTTAPAPVTPPATLTATASGSRCLGLVGRRRDRVPETRDYCGV